MNKIKKIFGFLAGFIFAVGDDLNGGNERTHCAGNIDDAGDFAAGGGMEIGGNETVRFGKELIFFDFCTRFHDHFGGLAHILSENDMIFLHQRSNLNGCAAGKFFVLSGGVDTAGE